MHIDWHCLCGDVGSAHVSYPEGERCVSHCQQTRYDCEGKGYRPIPHTDRCPAFSAMLQASRSKFLPKAFTSDLSLDYMRLMGTPTDREVREAYTGRFIWVLRESGTEFYCLDGMTHQDLMGSLAGYAYWTGDGRGRDTQQFVYYWDGQRLVEIEEHIGTRLIRHAEPARA
jgi:hypothetical protein